MKSPNSNRFENGCKNNNEQNRKTKHNPIYSLIIRLAGFTFAMVSFVDCSIFSGSSDDFCMGDAHGFAAAFPHALVLGVVAGFICWLTTSIDFAGFANRAPHDTWEDHDWCWSSISLLLSLECLLTMVHVWLVYHHGHLLVLGHWNSTGLHLRCSSRLSHHIDLLFHW